MAVRRQTAWDHASYFLYAWLGINAYCCLVDYMDDCRVMHKPLDFNEMLAFSLIAHLHRSLVTA